MFFGRFSRKAIAFSSKTSLCIYNPNLFFACSSVTNRPALMRALAASISFIVSALNSGSSRMFFAT